MRGGGTCAPVASSNCEWLEGDDTGNVMDDVDLGTLELEATVWKGIEDVVHM